ncbi:unnamed protein product [Periconia digitata]|uniref:N-acetyltransferase domain-containing protein n=1 Tax=Periconia digitata TaxID=1303443 RepID=A0A9W4XYD8_9PLEO|nr:unnamed protein product [Periconia digitata]
MPSDIVLPLCEMVRLATVHDLERIATVAAAGFYHSPTFKFQRKYHAKYPDDTLLSYKAEYRDSIVDPECVVLVAEDTVKDVEGLHVYDALRGAVTYKPASSLSRGRIIVGVSSISIVGSRYVGRFQPENVLDASAASSHVQSPNRDVCPKASQLYSAMTGPAKAKHLAGQMRLSTLAVHPAYWGRGHAQRLVHWCTQLADLEGVPVGISAAPMGAIIAAKAGFERQELVRIDPGSTNESTPCEEDAPVDGCVLWVAVRRPRSLSPSSNESATSLSPGE